MEVQSIMIRIILALFRNRSCQISPPCCNMEDNVVGFYAAVPQNDDFYHATVSYSDPLWSDEVTSSSLYFLSRTYLLSHSCRSRWSQLQDLVTAGRPRQW